jgi:hypothetical protein
VRKLVATALLVALTGFVTYVTLASPIQPMTPGSDSSLLTDAELADLGLRWDPVPASAATARKTVPEIVAAAASQLGRSDAPAEVLRGLVRQYADSQPQTAYIVIYTGGDAEGAGPNGTVITPRLTGVVIDDQTGEFLRGFAIGDP